MKHGIKNNKAPPFVYYTKNKLKFFNIKYLYITLIIKIMNIKKKNAILYTRVSTDDQAQHGYSLIHQYDTLKSHCETSGITILKHFEEDYSAKNFDRPE